MLINVMLSLVHKVAKCWLTCAYSKCMTKLTLFVNYICTLTILSLRLIILLSKLLVFTISLGWREGMPWLYYQGTADTVINNTQKISFSVSFDHKDTIFVNSLQFYLAKYGLILTIDLIFWVTTTEWNA